MGAGGGFGFRLARAFVEIDVDMTRFTAGLARVQAALAGLGAKAAALGGGLTVARAPARSAAAELGIMGTAAAAVQRRLLALSAAYVSFRSVVALGRQGAGLEATAVSLQRITGLGRAQAQGLTENLRRMSLALAGVPMDRIFAIAEMGARLGIEGKNLDVFTRDMARVGLVLADIPIDEATTRMARLLAVFQRGPQDAIRLASALNQLDMASTASARDILDIASRLSGPASFLGMRPQQALALATALREAGVPLETGGTAMTQIMTRMASKKDVGKFAAVSGMGVKQFESVLGSDPLRAIKAFEEGLARIDKAQGPIAAVRVLDQLHLDGQRVRGTLLQLGRVMEQLNRYEEIAAQEWGSTNSIMGGSAKVANTLSAQWSRLGNTFTALIQDIGTALGPAFKGAVEGLRMLLEDLRSALAENQGAVKTFATWLGVTFMAIGDSPRSVVLALKIIKTYLLDFRDFFINILARVVLRAVDAFVFLRDSALVHLRNVGTIVANVCKGIAGVVTTTFTSVISKVTVLVSNALAGLKGLLGLLPAGLVARVPGLAGLAGALPAKAMKVPDLDFGLAGLAPAAIGAGVKAFPRWAPPDRKFPDPVDRGPERDRLWALIGLPNRWRRDLAQRGLADLRERLTRAFVGGGEAPTGPPHAPPLARLAAVRAARVRAAEALAGGRLFAGPAPAFNPLLPSPEAARAVMAARGAASAERAEARHARAELMRSARVARVEAAGHAAFRARIAGPPGPGVEARVRREGLAGVLEANRRTLFRRLLAGAPGPAGVIGAGVGVAFRGAGGIAPGTPGPIAARIARARARRHARDRPGALAAGLHAFAERIRRIGVVDPVLAARIAAEAKKREENQQFANMIATAIGNVFGVGGGDALQKFANIVKGVGALK